MSHLLVITKHRFLGDTIVALPLLQVLREQNPDSELAILTGAGAAQLLQNHPALTCIHTYGPGTGERSRRGSLRLMQSLLDLSRTIRRTERPDQIFVVDRSFRAALGAVLCGGRERIGFDTEGRGFLLTRRVAYDPSKPETECGLDLLRATGVPVATCPRPALFVTPAERAAGAARLPAGLCIGLQPGASHAEKRWPLDRLATLADQLVTERNAQIVLVGGPEETAAAEELALTMRQPIACDLTGKTKLRETMGVLANLTAFFGNDTGVNHIAAALGCPTVALFGPTPAHKWGWQGEHNRVLVAPDGQMTSLSLDAARAALEELLPR